MLATPGPIGTQIDRYRLELLLGAGAFGVVYRARHVHTMQAVALKTLKRQLSADPPMVERFLREARAAASIGSEHIVKVMDAGVATDGTAFLAMELLEGADLQELVRRGGPIAPARLLDLLGQVLDALAIAHQQGIIHRDLKPANVFVLQRKDAHGVECDFVKLLDFGISKIQETMEVGGLTASGIAMGTPGYMSPEQFFNAKHVDARADLYSVGAMAYQLFSGRLPLEAPSVPELIVRLKGDVPVPLATRMPGLAAPICAAVDKALSRAPDDRFASAAEFAKALRAAASVRGGVLLATDAAIPSAPAEPAPSMLFGPTRPPTPVGSATPSAITVPANAFPSSAPGASPTPRPTGLALLARLGIRSRAAQGLVGMVWLLGLVAIGYAVWARRPVPIAGQPVVMKWRLAETDCPAGTMPPRVETTTTDARFVSRSDNFPESKGLLEPGGKFRLGNGFGVCVGTFTGRAVAQTCTNLTGQACQARYERDD